MLFSKWVWQSAKHLSYKCGAWDRNVAGTSSLARSWKLWGYESEGAIIVKELGADACGGKKALLHDACLKEEPHTVIHNQHPQEWGSLCFCFLRSLNRHCSGTCLFSSYQHQKPIFIASYILSPTQCWQLFSHPLPALEIPAPVMGSSCKLFNWKEFLSGLKMSGGWRRRVSIKWGLIYSATGSVWITENPSHSMALSSFLRLGGC